MLAPVLALTLLAAPSGADPQGAASAGVQRRLDELARAGQPLVAHAVVALADNEHQGLVPVPKALGNGQDPEHNLYWGARYGVGFFFGHDGGWEPVKGEAGALPAHVLRRAVFRKKLLRPNGVWAWAWLVADAYDGAHMREALADFLAYSAGHNPGALHAGDAVLPLGGAAPVLAFVGHDGLMDLEVPPPPAPPKGAPARGALVLACKSHAYFGALLGQAGAAPLVLTTGLMAPEAYVLDAALRSLFAGEPAPAAREAAAQAYDKYQQCGLGGARRLFSGAE